MSNDHLETPTDRLSPLPSLEAVVLHDLVRWRGIIAEVVDVAHLGSHYVQVVLQRLDRQALPISLPLTDLEGAEVWRLAGKLH